MLKEINYVPEGTYLLKAHRISEVLGIIKERNPIANYTNKRAVLDVLQKAVKNGANLSNQAKHVENIKDILGKHRIFD